MSAEGVGAHDTLHVNLTPLRYPCICSGTKDIVGTAVTDSA